MSSPLSEIVLRPISPSEDFLPLARVEDAAFRDDPFTIVAFGPQRGSEENLAVRAKGLAKSLTDTKDSEGRDKQWKYVKAVKKRDDGQGEGEVEEIVGWASWFFITGKGDATQKANGADKEDEKDVDSGSDSKSDSENPAPSPWGVGANVKFCEDVFLPGDQMMLDSCKGDEYAKLTELVVVPQYQRKGIGTLLLKAGLEEADARALQCVLGASPEGEGLYKRYGFEIVSGLDLKLWEYEGGEGLGRSSHNIMHRPANNVGL